jgi:hypothetical protein
MTTSIEKPSGAHPDSLPVVIDLVTAACILGIERTFAYELVRAGSWQPPIIRIGRLIKVPSAPLPALLDEGNADRRAPSRTRGDQLEVNTVRENASSEIVASQASHLAASQRLGENGVRPGCLARSKRLPRSGRQRRRAHDRWDRPSLWVIGVSHPQAPRCCHW